MEQETNESDPQLTPAEIIDHIDSQRSKMLSGEMTPDEFARDFLDKTIDLTNLGVSSDADIRPFLEYFSKIPEVYLPLINTMDTMVDLMGKIGPGTLVQEILGPVITMVRNLGLDNDPQIKDFIDTIADKYKTELEKYSITPNSVPVTLDKRHLISVMAGGRPDGWFDKGGDEAHRKSLLETADTDQKVVNSFKGWVDDFLELLNKDKQSEPKGEPEPQE